MPDGHLLFAPMHVPAIVPNPTSGARRRRIRGLLRVLALAVLLIGVYAVIPLQTDRWWLGMLIGVVALVAIAPFAIRRAAAVSTSEQPMLDAIEAITMVVAMLVFGFSSVFLAINRGDGEFVGLSTKIDAVYFTITTMSTVGFGDIHASGQAARVAVSIQIIFDLSLLAMSLRLLIGSVRRRSAGNQT